jgi:translation initiation factor 2B subunit (eIF-2B alpha/beta/delta family)
VQWPTLIAPLRADNTSGAAELARKAAVAVLEWLDQTASTPFAALSAELLAFAAALYRAQPAMAPLFNLVNEVLLAAESARTSEELQRRIHGAAQAFLEQMQQANARLAMASTELFPLGTCVLTFSYSSTVLGVLREAQAQQRLSKVFCTESRPMQEGQRLARQLAGAGMAVRFGVDTAMATFARRANIVLVGADSLTARGVVNKLGTTGLTLVARHAGLPCYVIGDRHKWFPVAAPAPVFGEIQPAVEVWPEPPEGVSIWNAYFECTPLELFSGIIGEEGLLAPGDLRRQLTDMPIARALRSGANAP